MFYRLFFFLYILLSAIGQADILLVLVFFINYA
jgi:hypothetical protein